jgi:hypothetical protein
MTYPATYFYLINFFLDKRQSIDGIGNPFEFRLDELIPEHIANLITLRRMLKTMKSDPINPNDHEGPKAVGDYSISPSGIVTIIGTSTAKLKQYLEVVRNNSKNSCFELSEVGVVSSKHSVNNYKVKKNVRIVLRILIGAFPNAATYQLLFLSINSKYRHNATARQKTKVVQDVVAQLRKGLVKNFRVVDPIVNDRRSHGYRLSM